MKAKPNRKRGRLMCLAGLLFSLHLPSGLVFAEPVGKSQPNRLDFGSVQKDATVQGSLLIFGGVEGTPDLSFHVQPPPFANVTRIDRGHVTSARNGTQTTHYVSVAVRTEEIGEHAGDIVVELGSQESRIPIKVTVLAPDTSATSVLVVSSPFNSASTDDATVFEPWLRLVESARLAPNYVGVGRDGPALDSLGLSRYDVILLAGAGLRDLPDSAIVKLKQFVTDGGRLLVCANCFYRGTVEAANKLLDSAGLRMTDTEPGENKPIALTGDDIESDPLTKAVRKVKWFHPSPVAVTDTSRAKILVHAPPYPGEGYLAIGKLGKGQVIALGQSLWWNWIGGAQGKDSDNQQLLLNLVAKRSE